MRSFLWNLLSSHHTIAPRKQNISLIFLVSTIIGGNFFSAVLRLLLSFPPPSHLVSADGSVKTDGRAYFLYEAVPVSERRMREATFRFPTRETPFKGKEITFRNECPAYAREDF